MSIAATPRDKQTHGTREHGDKGGKWDQKNKYPHDLMGQGTWDKEDKQHQGNKHLNDPMG